MLTLFAAAVAVQTPFEMFCSEAVVHNPSKGDVKDVYSLFPLLVNVMECQGE